MKIKHIHLMLGFLGIVLPYSQFLPWLAAQPLAKGERRKIPYPVYSQMARLALPGGDTTAHRH